MNMIFLDLDGTLLDSNKALSPENYNALKRCAERGVHIVPATGRFYAGMPEAIRALPFVRYVVAINGAQIYDAAEQRVLYRAEIPLDTALRIYNRLDAFPLIYECYQEDWGYIPSAFFAQADRFVSDKHVLHMVRTLRKPVDDFRGFLLQRNRTLQKIQMFFQDSQVWREVFKLLPGEFPETAVASSIHNAIEITDRAATKGEALRFLCRHLKVDIQNTMAFGDNSNDLSMITAAGLGVAMANAEPEVRQAANYVTDTNDRDGVAKALERFVL